MQTGKETELDDGQFRLPRGVYLKSGSYYLVRENRWQKLCRAAEGRAALFARLYEVDCSPEGTVAHAIFAYLRDGMDELSPETKKWYQGKRDRMLHHFGHCRLDEIRSTHVSQYLKWCRKEGHAVGGNRDKSFMMAVYEYARGEGWVIDHNPFRGVKRNKERPSRTYVEHQVLVDTINRAPSHLQALIAIGYLSGMRQTDLMALKWNAIQKDGMHVQESKTRKRHLHQLTDTGRVFLRFAVEHKEAVAVAYEKSAGRLTANGQHSRAQVLLRRAEEVRHQSHVFLSSKGRPWTSDSLQRAITRFDAPFTFRQLRPKAQSDQQKKNILGHSGQMKEIYERFKNLDAVK